MEEQQQQPSVLCFFAERIADKVMEILHFTHFPQDDVKIEQDKYTIKTWKLFGRITFRSLLINQEVGGNVALLKKLKLIHQRDLALAPLLVFDPSVSLVQKQLAEVNDIVEIVFSTSMERVVQFFWSNVVLDREQIRRLDELLFQQARREVEFTFPDEDFLRRMLTFTGLTGYRNVTLFGANAQGANRDHLPDWDSDLDSEEEPEEDYSILNTVIELSMHTPQPAAPSLPRPQKKLKLLEDWNEVLKEAEDVKEGSSDPVCITCCSKRATVCFVECGDQVMCDDCVRKMYSYPEHAQKRTCPVCQRQVDHIIRPNVSGVKN